MSSKYKLTFKQFDKLFLSSFKRYEEEINDILVLKGLGNRRRHPETGEVFSGLPIDRLYHPTECFHLPGIVVVMQELLYKLNTAYGCFDNGNFIAAASYMADIGYRLYGGSTDNPFTDSFEDIVKMTFGDIEKCVSRLKTELEQNEAEEKEITKTEDK